MVRVPVDYGDGKKVEVECPYFVVTKDGARYRSKIHTNPVTRKRCYVEFDPYTKEVKVVEVE